VWLGTNQTESEATMLLHTAVSSPLAPSKGCNEVGASAGLSVDARFLPRASSDGRAVAQQKVGGPRVSGAPGRKQSCVVRASSGQDVSGGLPEKEVSPARGTHAPCWGEVRVHGMLTVLASVPVCSFHVAFDTFTL
jgi:hypothetical protein